MKVKSDVPALLAEIHRLRGLVEAAYKEGAGFDEPINPWRKWRCVRSAVGAQLRSGAVIAGMEWRRAASFLRGVAESSGRR